MSANLADGKAIILILFSLTSSQTLPGLMGFYMIFPSTFSPTYSGGYKNCSNFILFQVCHQDHVETMR